MSRQEKIDFYTSKLISRKMLAFVLASIGLFTGFITSSDWVIMATVYIAIEGATNIVERIKSTN